MKIRPKILLLHGDDVYRLRLALDRLKADNPEAMPCKVNPMGDLYSQVFGLSLFADRRLLLIDLLEFEGDQLERLIDELADAEISGLIAFYRYGRLDRRLKIAKELEKIAQVKTFEAFKPWDDKKALAWLQDEILPLSPIWIGPEALKKLAELTQNESTRMVSELEKLYCYAPDQEISIADVLAVCHQVPGLEELIESLLRGKYHLFLEKLTRHEVMIPTIAGLQTAFRSLLTLKSLEHRPMAEIASNTGKHPFYLSKELKKVSPIPLEHFQRILFLLNNLEFNLKSGGFFEDRIGISLTVLRELILEDK